MPCIKGSGGSTAKGSACNVTWGYVGSAVLIFVDGAQSEGTFEVGNGGATAKGEICDS